MKNDFIFKGISFLSKPYTYNLRGNIISIVYMEVGTVFVRPDYKRQGVDNLLLNGMYQVLKNVN